jgi:hypothetical protein
MIALFFLTLKLEDDGEVLVLTVPIMITRLLEVYRAAMMEEDDLRLLEEGDDDGTEPTEGNDSEVLRDTLRIYGSLFLMLLLLFCILRRRYPRAYNIRNWLDEIKTDLASDQRGFISWMWKLFLVTDSEMLDECGMDALCFTRVLEFGLKLSAVGMMNAIWLIPVYMTAESSPETDYITDPIISISVSNLPPGSYRFCATVVGAYVIFGYTMYNILREFDWFIRFRHDFLKKKLCRNYCVYVQNIPEEYRSNAKLLEFFAQASAEGAVLDAQVAFNMPHLKKKVAEREKLVAKLEHAINVEEVRGITPMRRATTGPDVSLVDGLFDELGELNKYITEAIEKIELKSNDVNGIVEDELDLNYPPLLIGTASCSEQNSDDGLETTVTFDTDPTPLGSPPGPPGEIHSNLFANHESQATKNAKNITSRIPTQSVWELANQAISLIAQEEDGEPHSAGFVKFKSLRSAQAALQMIQYPEPFAMEVLEAPQAEGT